VPDSEFVTISRASHLLEAPERTVRRMAAKLADTDRQVADRGTRLVRLGALASLMGKELPSAPAPEVAATESTGGGQVADTLGDVADTSEGLADKDHPVSATVGHLADASMVRTIDAEKRAAVAEARAELLERELVAWKEQAGKLDSRLAEALEALQQAQDETRATRALSARSAMQIEPSERAGGDSTGDASGGGIVSPDQDKPAGAGFWGAVARLFGRTG